MHVARFFRVGVCLCFFASTPCAASTTATGAAHERPLIVAADGGEKRVWRPLASLPPAEQKLSIFSLKIDAKNGGSQGMWFGSETMPAGAAIGRHRHLHEDEVLYIGSGTARVHVGELQGIANAGALVFIPHGTWVSVENIGKTPIALVYAFNAPAFNAYMRCESVPLGNRPLQMTDVEDRRCSELGDVEYAR